MKKWEYHRVEELFQDSEHFMEFLNSMGEEGWELVNTVHHFSVAYKGYSTASIFKREVIE